MRIAILSDIHGNLWALEKVLADAEARGVDAYVNLGDVLFGPLDPKGTWERVKDEPWITIQGNQDRALYEATAQELAENETLAFVVSEVGQEAVDWCEALPETTVFEDTFLCHGTPESDLEYLLEDVSTGFPTVKEPREIQRLLAPHPQSLILCGHTHVPRTVQLPDGKIVLNPGSIGLPAYGAGGAVPHAMEGSSPHASYAIAERRGNGPWTLEHRRIPYPHQEAARRAKELGREDWAAWIATGFAR